MRKFLTLTAIALALGAAGCARKRGGVNSTPPVAEAPGTAAANPDDAGELTELPAMQAALRAAAGSDTIYFNTDKSEIDAPSQATLAAQAKWMLANPAVRASVEGHADERGTREYNQALGERRAQAAKLYLMSKGVPEARLLTVSWGKERPVAVGSTEQAWAQNRRAVTVVVK
ncbi:peptidoglycan-associated lipoprotein Pal [Sphingomonas ginkgonis]|uniref:Peptidoglycan-associated lipoprotein n=1 Tax=Sphingomonas ginkgonis TaxID=2315330 RepID=A0A3R9YJV6_9SPHN|nr:peptidoglycan-associated lipoprotein Pal [Sphingomonas ginkgonis]RST29409.1 peptidoglycan-associated lipoprotein Pal [Sphingomonas ginkgonis]